MSSATPHAVFFDLDGTLVDTAPGLTYALNQLLVQYHQPSVSVASVREIISEGTTAIIACGFKNSPDIIIDEALTQQYLDYYLEHMCYDTNLFTDFDQVFQYLSESNIPWGIVTNKLAWLTKPLLSALELSHLSQCVVCGDEVEHPKPYPDALLKASRQLNFSPQQCLYVGDAEMDMIAGRRAGMRTVLARYGYIKTDAKPDTWGADHHINAPIELINYLKHQ